jgi:Arc/MetJ-type ribon-helix-helix transcriptional regulator
MIVKLSPTLEKRLAEHVSQRPEYASEDAFVELAVRSLLDYEDFDQERLEVALTEGLDSAATPLTAMDWQEVRDEGMKQLAARKAQRTT